MSHKAKANLKNVRLHVENLTPFDCNGSLYGQIVAAGIYAVYSYGEHFPIYAAVEEKGWVKWYGNRDKYSRTTSRHQSAARPGCTIVWTNTAILKAIIAGDRAARRNAEKVQEIDEKKPKAQQRKTPARSVGAAAAHVVEYVKDIEVSVTNYDAFQVHNWTLVIHKTVDGVHKETRRFWLGQDAKVCSRILGADSRSLISAWEEETGNRLQSFNDLKGWLAEKIIEAQQVDVEKIFTDAEDWQLAAQ